jgi:hypothetical protein
VPAAKGDRVSRMEWGSSNPHTVDEGSVPAFLIVNDMVAAIPFNGSMHSGHVWMRDHQTASIAAPNIKRQGIDGVNAPNAVGIEHETGSLLRFGIDGHVGGDSPGSLRVSGIRYRSLYDNASREEMALRSFCACVRPPGTLFAREFPLVGDPFSFLPNS